MLSNNSEKGSERSSALSRPIPRNQRPSSQGEIPLDDRGNSGSSASGEKLVESLLSTDALMYQVIEKGANRAMEMVAPEIEEATQEVAQDMANTYREGLARMRGFLRQTQQKQRAAMLAGSDRLHAPVLVISGATDPNTTVEAEIL